MLPFDDIIKGQLLTVLENITGKQVPQGIPLAIKKDDTVIVTQALGNSITLDIGGRLIRVETEDISKLGVSVPVSNVDPIGSTLEAKIWNLLRESYDPEIPVNIVELGLIYDLRISKLIDGRTHVQVDMTLTAPGCGMGPIMARDIKEKIEALDGVDQSDIQMVFDPPWDVSRMTEEARLEAGLF